MTDELSHEQRKALREALENEQAALREEIRAEVLAADLHRSEEVADRVRDAGDESLVDLLADIEYADIDRHIAALRANEAALRAWHEGGYGRCVDCGEPIPFERLQALPSAARCIDCETRREQQAGGRPPRL